MSSQPSSLLRHRPFLAFWLARVCTASGFQMLTVAIGWHIYELTGNVLDLGLVGLVEFLPRVLFMLHTGMLPTATTDAGSPPSARPARPWWRWHWCSARLRERSPAT